MNAFYHPTLDGFTLAIGGRTLIRHTPTDPWLYAGRGAERMEMYRGNFAIEDFVVERVPLPHVSVHGTRLEFRRHADDALQIAVEIEVAADRAVLRFVDADPAINRLWIRLVAETGRALSGAAASRCPTSTCAAARFPLWTSEPGVGRDRTTLITWQADVEGRAGGDYYTTNYPQPTFLSSRRYTAHLATTAYAEFDFRHDDFHELQVWAVPEALEIWTAPTLARPGRREPRPLRPPAAAARMGLPGCDHRPEGRRSAASSGWSAWIEAGVEVAGLWCEDWAGLRETSFGTRLFWDWAWSPERYPDLQRRIAALAERGIRSSST